MRRAALLGLVVFLVSVEPAAAAPLHSGSFHMPSRNVGCIYSPAAGGHAASIRCDILSGLVPEPTRACELDWTGLGMTGARRARPVCAGDTAYSTSSPVLRYGRAWTRGPFRCTSRTTGLACSSRAGHGFKLARAGWSVH